MLSMIIAIIVSGTALGGGVQPPAGTTTTAAAVPDNPAMLWQTKSRIRLYVKSARHWQALMGLRPSKVSRLAYDTTSVAYAKWSLKKWMTLSGHLHARARKWMAKRITTYQKSVHRWSRSMGRSRPGRQLTSAGGIEARFDQWRKMAGHVYTQYINPPEKPQFECIHRFEGSWTDRDSGHNGHYGGVQMGKAEWDKYGKPYTGKDYPYQASKSDQLWAAYRYYLVSGFDPWPQTRLDCGL